MTTATPLSLPFVLQQSDRPTSSQISRRRWKPDRPNYRALLSAHHSAVSTDGASTSAPSRFQTAVKPASSQQDSDQLEADLEEWGLPSAHTSASTSTLPRLAAPVSAISWDENSALSSSSHFESQQSAALTPFASLNQWDPSISFAPYVSSGLRQVELPTSEIGSDATNSLPLKYNPGLGRVFAVGREDGTVSVYRAYGRTEDYEALPYSDPSKGDADESMPASASASANLSHTSVAASRRDSLVLRSPEAETPMLRLPSMSKSASSSGREPSPLLSSFSHLDRSSLAARSTVSAASVTSTAATNVQLEDGAPAGSLQSNVTATGHTAGRNYLDRAENRLELQMAAAERNDHQHGVVGGVIERLGLSSHSHSHSQSHSHSHSHSHSASPHLGPSSPGHNARQTYHRTRSSESRHSSVTPPGIATPAEGTLPSPMSPLQGSDAKGVQTASAAGASTSVEPSLKTSTSDAWLHDPNRGTFSHVMTLLTKDRSPVVALRLVPLPCLIDEGKDEIGGATLRQPTSEKAALLVVQEAGNVSMWSLLEGTMLWQTDVTTAQVVSTGTEANEATTKDVSASLGVMHSLRGQLPASLSTPLTRSPAGSARASPRPTLAGGDASLRRSMLRSALSGADSGAASRLREAHGVQLSCSVQVLSIQGTPTALLWDSHSSSALLLDLVEGRLLLHEQIDDVHAAATPTLRHLDGSQDRVELVWFTETDSKLQSHPLRIVVSRSDDTNETEGPKHTAARLQGIVLEEDAANAQQNESKHWTFANTGGPVTKIYYTHDHIIVLMAGRIVVQRSVDGQKTFSQEATSDQFKSLCGTSRDAQQLLIQTSSGLVNLDLTTKQMPSCSTQGIETVKDLDSIGGKLAAPSLTPPARLRLCWNLPQSGALLYKVFLVQPLLVDSQSANETVAGSTERDEFAAWNLTEAQIESVLSTTSAHRDLDPSPKEDTASGGQDSQIDRITAVLPLSLERVAVASSGGLRVHSLVSLSASAAPPTDHAEQSDDRNSLGPDHNICILRSAVAPRSNHRLIVGGTLQGEVGFWDASASTGQGSNPAAVPKLEAAVSVSTTPVEALVVFGDDDNTIRLHGCIACVCADSSVTIILFEGFRQLYTVPGRGARLTSLAVRADELLVTYDDGKARVWDLRSQELRRSIATDQAQALVEDGKGWWTVKPIEAYSPLHAGTTGVLSQLAAARDIAAASLLVDFRRAIEAAARSVRGTAQSGSNEATASNHPSLPPTITARAGTATTASLQPPSTLQSEQDRDRASGSTLIGLGTPAARKAVNIVRPLLPTVFPVGLDAALDAKLAALLDLHEPGTEKSKWALTVGLHSAPDALMVGGLDPDRKDAWKLSSRLTTMRLLVASALLRVLSNVKELRALTDELQRFVQDETFLASLVGVGFRGVTLGELVPYLLDANLELQNASRSIFQGALTRLDQDQLDDVCNQWQGHLVPAKITAQASKTRSAGLLSPSTESGAELRTRALTLLGSIAVERYTSMSPRLLKDIAINVHDAIVSDKGIEMRTVQELQMLGVAIDLCRSGFSVWQHYFDATEVVRSLFALSTSTAGGHSADGELRTLARSATLQIAAENTPLFMTTLSLDILHARSAAHCAATMRLVAFMVRKRPSVLVANLPRLAEALVKSLDPTHTTMREAVVNAATVMISELVSTYPSVSFFGGGQRLAVGTHEGAVIMYDLKTATRLYVLEGHRRRADAVSFSPDGRRLVTMSLEEGRVLVWKTSSGFSSFFSPGQMPRQGAADVKLTDGAYRAFLFNVGEQHSMPRSGSLGESLASFAPVHSGDHGGNGHEEEFVGFDRIGFHWNSERSVKVQIGEAQLNISVD